MAIDTEQKRRAVVAAGQVWMGPSVLPDATIDAGDRSVIGYSFFGLGAAAAGNVKTWNGLVFASIKTYLGLAAASTKTVKGVTTT